MATVLVNRITTYNRRGEARLSAAKPVIQNIECFYIGGKVKTQTGDVWRVKPHSGNGADFIVDEPVTA